MRQLSTWALLLVISLVVHAIISWRVADDITAPLDFSETVEIRISVAEPPPKPPEQAPPEDPLEFEEDFEIEPPDTLIAPQAVTPAAAERASLATRSSRRQARIRCTKP